MSNQLQAHDVFLNKVVKGLKMLHLEWEEQAELEHESNDTFSETRQEIRGHWRLYIKA